MSASPQGVHDGGSRAQTFKFIGGRRVATRANWSLETVLASMTEVPLDLINFTWSIDARRSFATAFVTPCSSVERSLSVPLGLFLELRRPRTGEAGITPVRKRI